MGRMAPTRKTPSRPRQHAPSASQMGRVLLMLENIQDQQKMLAEALGAFRSGVDVRFDEMEARLTRRLDVLEAVVREHSAMLKEHRTMLEEHGSMLMEHGRELCALRAELDRISRKLDHMASAAALEALEKRVAALEARVGIAQ